MAKRLTSEQKDRFNRFVEAALTGPTAHAVEQELSGLSIPSPFRLRMKVLYGATDPLRHVRTLAAEPRSLRPTHRRLGPPPPKPWALEAVSPESPGFILTGAWGREVIKDFRVPFALLPTEKDRVTVAVTIAHSPEWGQFLRLIGWQYPDLVPITLTQRELIEGVRAYRDQANGFAVRVKEYSARERGAGGEYRRTVREWTDEQLSGVVEQIYTRQQVIKSIKLAFFRTLRGQIDPVPALDAKITRTGQVEISGRYQLAKQTVVERLAAVGSAKLMRYSGRGMRERQYSAAPLRIAFRSKVFADIEELRKLVDILKGYPNSMYSVQHGNPYMHMRLFDVFDGSGFDLWAVADDSLVLMPRTSASEAAIERLITYVFEEYREGEIRDVRAA